MLVIFDCPEGLVHVMDLKRSESRPPMSRAALLREALAKHLGVTADVRRGNVRCLRRDCGYCWTARRDEVKVCPRCKSAMIEAVDEATKSQEIMRSTAVMPLLRDPKVVRKPRVAEPEYAELARRGMGISLPVVPVVAPRFTEPIPAPPVSPRVTEYRNTFPQCKVRQHKQCPGSKALDDGIVRVCSCRCHGEQVKAVPESEQFWELVHNIDGGEVKRFANFKVALRELHRLGKQYYVRNDKRAWYWEES